MFKWLVRKLKRIARRDVKIVIVMRTDVEMEPGKIALRAANVAISLYESAIRVSNPHLQSWIDLGCPKEVFSAESYDELMLVYIKAQTNNLYLCTVKDPSKILSCRRSITAIGIGPNPAKHIDKLTSDLELF